MSDYGYDTYDDQERQEELADLQARIAELQSSPAAPVPTAAVPSKPVTDLNAALAAAQSKDEVTAVIEAHNAAVLADNPPEPVIEIDHEALQAQIATANSPEELRAILEAHGGSLQ